MSSAGKRQKKEEKGFWRKVRRLGRHLPFLPEAFALYYYITDGDVH